MNFRMMKRHTLFKTLEFTQAVEVLEELDTYDKYILLSNINISYAVKLISEMSTDEVVDFLASLTMRKKSSSYHF